MGSIPVVLSKDHTGRNPTERALGYHFVLQDKPSTHVYSEEHARENLAIFLRQQTRMPRDAPGHNVTAGELLRRCTPYVTT